MKNMNDKNSKTEAEELRMLYQITIDDIRYAKRQQWAITYYGLLLITGILGFYKLIQSSKTNIACFEKGILFALAVLIALMGTWILCTFQKSLCEYRERLVRIINKKENFSKKFKDALGDISRDYTSFYYYFGSIVFPFILILWIAAGFVFWIFYR